MKSQLARVSDNNIELLQLLDSIDTGIYRTSIDGKILYCNSALARILGYKNPQELKKISVYDIYVDQTARDCQLKHWAKNHKIISADVQLKTKSGKRIWVNDTGKIIKNIEGPKVCCEGIIQDITEQKELKESLKRVAAEWNITFDTISDCVSLINKDGLILRCNKAMAKYTGLPFDKILDQSICKILHQNVHESNTCLFSLVKKSKQRESQIIHVGAAWFQSVMEPILQNSGELSGAVHFMIDITDAKEKEIKLQEHKKFFQLAIDSLTHPFYIIDIKTYELIMKNKAVDAMNKRKNKYCYTLTENMTEPCREKKNACPIDIVKKSKKPIVIEHTHVGMDKSEKICEIHSFPIFNSKGELIQIIQYSIDITDKKKAVEREEKQKEALRHADRMISLGILVSGVAHEINNPNNSILMNGDFIKKSFADIFPILDDSHSNKQFDSIGGLLYDDFKESIPEVLDGISKGSRRIKSIVDELKSYSKKNRSIIKDVIDINLVIRSCLKLLNGIIKKSTKFLKVNLKNSLPMIYGSKQHLEQVFVNLIHNSCQALDSVDKPITISTRTDSKREQITVVITDKGSGIEKENLKFIKEPFFTTKRNAGGVGLGLSISSKIIEEHGGSMEFSSKTGVGTTVKVCIPVNHNIHGKQDESH